MRTINNIPIQCNLCGNIAYGQEQIVDHGAKKLLECTWVCRLCGGVVKRETEDIPIHENKEISK